MLPIYNLRTFLILERLYGYSIGKRSFNEKGDTIKEVKRSVATSKRASGDLHRIWRNRDTPIPLKRKLVKLMIWPIMSYGSETWIYLKSEQNMIKVFERWCYRRMLRISRTEHVTNEEVFNRANTKSTLLDRGDLLSMVT